MTLIDPRIVAAAITGMLTALIFIRKSSFTYVTSERALWRKDMKSSIVALVIEWNRNPKAQAVQQALESIKCNINPYGRLESLASNLEKLELGDPNIELYLKDAHIWEAIQAFDTVRSRANLDNLTYYLDLLLKYDWERSKAEVKVNIFYFIAFLSALLSCYWLVQTFDEWNGLLFSLVSLLYLMGTLGLCLLLFVFQQRFSSKHMKMGFGVFAVVAIFLVVLGYLSGDRHYIISFVCAGFTFAASAAGCFRGAYGITMQYVINANKYRNQNTTDK